MSVRATASCGEYKPVAVLASEAAATLWRCPILEARRRAAWFFRRGPSAFPRLPITLGFGLRSNWSTRAGNMPNGL